MAIAIFLFLWLVFFFASYFITPFIPVVAPTPLISGYIGFYAGLISLGIIPFLLLTWLLFKVIWGYEIGNRVRRAVFGVWIVGLFLFLTTGLFSIRQYVHQYSDTIVLGEQELSKESLITINIEEEDHSIVKRADINIGLGNAFLKQGKWIVNNVHIEFVPTQSDNLSLICTSSASGSSYDAAKKILQQYPPKAIIRDQQIDIRGHSELSLKDKYRRQCYDYDIKIPIGTQLKIIGSTRTIQDHDVKDHRLQSDRIYVMTERGLQLIES